MQNPSKPPFAFVKMVEVSRKQLCSYPGGNFERVSSPPHCMVDSHNSTRRLHTGVSKQESQKMDDELHSKTTGGAHWRMDSKQGPWGKMPTSIDYAGA